MSHRHQYLETLVEPLRDEGVKDISQAAMKQAFWEAVERPLQDLGLHGESEKRRQAALRLIDLMEAIHAIGYSIVEVLELSKDLQIICTAENLSTLSGRTLEQIHRIGLETSSEDASRILDTARNLMASARSITTEQRRKMMTALWKESGWEPDSAHSLLEVQEAIAHLPLKDADGQSA